MTTIRHDLSAKVQVIEHVWVPMPDGIRLSARIWRPAGPGAHPAILEYLPYRKRDGTRTRDQGIHMYLAAHGYACIRLDIRGTGDSEGLIADEYTLSEQQDGIAAIAWIAAQDWCDGQVAMIGISWGGFNGLQIAALRPPALRTVITVGSTDDRYATDVHYIGGCLSKDNFDWSATMLASNDLPPDPAIVGAAWRDMWLARARANTPWAHVWFAHQRRDGYWKQGSVCEDFSRIAVPVYAVSGWADNYSESIPRLMAGLSCPRRGLIGPWAHSYPHDAAVAPAIGWLQEVLRWCDHWMKGRDTGIMDEPLLRVWMQESVPPRTCYAERPGRWIGEDAWPSPRIAEDRLFLNADGRLGAAAGPPGEAAICSPLWVGLAAGEIGRYGGDADWPTDQREDDAGSLVFTTAPLAARTEILGAPRLELHFACDRPLALVAVRLNDVAPDGASTRVTLGLLNLTHRDSHEHAAALVPGQRYRAVVELDDIAHAFPAGHRIAVSLSTVYWPIAWPSPELATLTVVTGDSALVLPVRPPRAEDAALRPFDPPESAPQTPHEVRVAETAHPRRVTRDLLSGRMVVDFPRWTYACTMTDIGVTATSAGFARYTITDGDPLSAVLETGYDVALVRPDATCGHRSTGRLSSDATHFILETTLSVTENGAEIFRRDWQERIPRDHV
ncbi:MAG: CocE/NonD family hydrolase [Rhodobacteraceae bacterium]|nr:CocE/NonD family hydrolase [Paracoccaceae bacterium]